jgi:hypothetical protein
MMAIADPCGRQASAAGSPIAMVGEGHALLWQYFSRLLNSQTSPSRTPKDVNHGHPSIFTCK